MSCRRLRLLVAGRIRTASGHADKSAFHWVSVIRLPDFITPDDFVWAVLTAEKKKKLDCSKAEFLTIDEGLCVQIMHHGAFDDEPASVALMDTFLAENGLYKRLYRCAPAPRDSPAMPVRSRRKKWKTVIRHPIKKSVKEHTP